VVHSIFFKFISSTYNVAYLFIKEICYRRLFGGVLKSTKVVNIAIFQVMFFSAIVIEP